MKGNWERIGLKVKDKYEDNLWLGKDEKAWPIVYHGLKYNVHIEFVLSKIIKEGLRLGKK